MENWGVVTLDGLQYALLVDPGTPATREDPGEPGGLEACRINIDGEWIPLEVDGSHTLWLRLANAFYEQVTVPQDHAMAAAWETDQQLRQSRAPVGFATELSGLDPNNQPANHF